MAAAVISWDTPKPKYLVCAPPSSAVAPSELITSVAATVCTMLLRTPKPLSYCTHWAQKMVLPSGFSLACQPPCTHQTLDFGSSPGRLGPPNGSPEAWSKASCECRSLS